MKRRAVIVLGALGATGVAAGAWLAGPRPPVDGFADFAAVRTWLAALDGARSTTAWPLPRVLGHLAQSVRYSIDGYPEPRSALFQATAGSAAFAVFDRRGRMRHGLEEPIPGAPDPDVADLAAGVATLDAAIARFDAHAGALAPHFAYGALDKSQYARAHLMHMAEHAQAVAGA